MQKFCHGTIPSWTKLSKTDRPTEYFEKKILCEYFSITGVIRNILFLLGMA
jgi:hypothetical protein